MPSPSSPMPEAAVEALYAVMPGKLEWADVEPERKKVWRRALGSAVSILLAEKDKELANSEAQVRLLRQRSGPKAIEAARTRVEARIAKLEAGTHKAGEAGREEARQAGIEALESLRELLPAGGPSVQVELPGEGRVKEVRNLLAQRLEISRKKRDQLEEEDLDDPRIGVWNDVVRVLGGILEASDEALASTQLPVSEPGKVSANARMLDEFHRHFNYERTSDPSLRRVLHQEEHEELVEALESGDLEAIARELADVVYVAYGSAWSLNLDLDAAIREVHRANLSKLDDDGKPIYREDGKVLKGPNFRRPDLRLALEGHPVTIDQERGGIFLSTPQSPQPQPKEAIRDVQQTLKDIIAETKDGRTREDLRDLLDRLKAPQPGDGSGVEEGLIRVDEDDRARLREIARLIEVDSRRDDAQRDARFLHRFAERPTQQPQLVEAGECGGRGFLTSDDVQRLEALIGALVGRRSLGLGVVQRDQEAIRARQTEEIDWLHDLLKRGTGEKQPRLGSVEELRDRLIDELEKARQGSVGATEAGTYTNLGDLLGADPASRERAIGEGKTVEVIALADVNAAIDAALTQPQDEQPQDLKRLFDGADGALNPEAYRAPLEPHPAEALLRDEQPRCGGSGKVRVELRSGGRSYGTEEVDCGGCIDCKEPSGGSGEGLLASFTPGDIGGLIEAVDARLAADLPEKGKRRRYSEIREKLLGALTSRRLDAVLDEPSSGEVDRG